GCAPDEDSHMNQAVQREDFIVGRLVISASDSVPGIAGVDPERVAVRYDGAIAVLGNSEPRITFLTTDFSVGRRFGSRGQGPGELTAAVGLFDFHGDELLIGSGSRVTVATAASDWQPQTWGTVPGHLL